MTTISSNETFFGLTKVRMSQADGRKLDVIAQEHGATFVGPLSIPGNDLRGWFSGPNRGEPFDRALREAVMADVQRSEPTLYAKLWGGAS